MIVNRVNINAGTKYLPCTPEITFAPKGVHVKYNPVIINNISAIEIKFINHF